MSTISSILLKNLKPKAKPGKSDNPEIELEPLKQCATCHKDVTGQFCSNCKESTNIADVVYNAYQASKDAETTYKVVEATMVEEVHNHYKEFAQSGRFSKTFNISGTSTPGVQVSFKDMFSEISSEVEPELKQLMGDDYNKNFKEVRTLTLKNTSDQNIEYLMEALGQEKFLELFDIKVAIACQSDMDRKQFSLPTKVQLMIKQWKPSTKLKKED